VLGFIPQPNLQGIHYQTWYNKLLPIGESVRVSDGPRGKIIEGVTTPLEPWWSKHWSPWSSKKIADYWQAYLTHKIVPQILEPDSNDLATLFYWLAPAKIFSLGHSTQNLDAALLSTWLSPLNPNVPPEELWEPESASYYNGELILQRPTAVDFGTTVRTFGYPPTVYWQVSPLRNDLFQIRNTPDSLGLLGVRVDGWFGVRRGFAAVLFL